MESIKNIFGNFCLGSRKKENKGKGREENLEEEEIELESNKSENVIEENQLEIEEANSFSYDNEEKVSTQEWLDKEYPKENRSEIGEIYLNEPNLAGGWVYLEDFIKLLRVYISPQVDGTRFTFINMPWDAKIIKCFNAQKWLENQEEYSTKTKRKEIKKLDIRLGNALEILEGELNLSDFTNLEYLDCHENNLTSLEVSNCKKLLNKILKIISGNAYQKKVYQKHKKKVNKLVSELQREIAEEQKNSEFSWPKNLGIAAVISLSITILVSVTMKISAHRKRRNTQ